MRYIKMILLGLIFVMLFACGQEGENAKVETNGEKEGLTEVSFLLEWTPNTNHTGIYVAIDQGFFQENGLDVEVMLPGEVQAEQLIASGRGDFGISVQERIFMARDEGIPIVSVAAIIQENTAGYASLKEDDITDPKDFENKIFGALGTDLERAIMKTIMKESDADFDKVEFVNIGDADFFAALEREIDFSLVYQGWTGIEAELREQELNMVYLKDVTESLNFYTPVIATSEEMIEENPELVEAFVQAAAKGYEYAIEHPKEAADILLSAVPDLDEALVHRSQEWLSQQYQGDAPQFGVQERKRWKLVQDFMLEHEIIADDIDLDRAFTNEFLEGSQE